MDLVTLADAATLPPEKRCSLGCAGVQLSPKSGSDFSVETLAQACSGIQKQLCSSGQSPVRIHVRARVEGSDEFCEPKAGQAYVEASVCFYAPAAPLAKEDYWLLARYRRLPFSGPALWKKNVPELQAILNAPLRPVEEAFLSREQAARVDFLRTCPWPVAELKKRLVAEGLSSSAGITRGGMADALRARPAYGASCSLKLAAAPNEGRFPGPADLDAHQQQAVGLGLSILTQVPMPGQLEVAQELLISAGPGAGKTTTLTNFLAYAVTKIPTARILVLMFNVEAESILRRRLTRAIGGSAGTIPKTKVADAGYRGCAVLTFDKMAYQILQNVRCEAAGAASDFGTKSGAAGAADSGTVSAELSALLGRRKTLPPRTQPSNYRDSKEQAARLLAEGGSQDSGIAKWDLIVVDEGQDVTPLEANIVEGLLRGRRPDFVPKSPAAPLHPGLIVAGDPRQEVYSGATWYSARWHAAGKAGQSGQGSRVVQHILANNYRSAPGIVAALNAYSKEAFPTLHHDQVAVRPADPNPPIRIVEVAGAAGSSKSAGATDTNIAIGQQVGAIMAERPPGESYGLVPVSLEKFKTDAATTAARQTLHEHRPAEYTLALTGASKIPEGDIYVLATARRIKGTERKLVVVYAADRDYDVTVDHASLAKLLYVALSRAQDELVLVTQKLDTQRIKGLMAPFVYAACAISPDGAPPGGAGGAGVVTTAPVEPPRRLKLTPVPVTGESLPNGATGMGVCQVPYGSSKPWSAEVGRITPLPVIGDAQVQLSQADFIGKLAEAHIALGVHTAWLAAVGSVRAAAAAASPLADPKNLEITVDPLRINHGLYTKYESRPASPRRGRTRYVLCTSAENRDQLQKLLQESYSSELQSTGAPYIHAMLAFTALCGRPWTVSSALADPALSAALAQDSVQVGRELLATGAHLLGVPVSEMGEPRYWTRGGRKLGACRPGDPRRPIDHHPAFADAEVSYETDILFEATSRVLPVELKHTSSLTPEHERQLYSYTALLTSASPARPPSALLYNGRSGELRVFTCDPAGFQNQEFTCRARSLLALRTARSAILLHLARHAIAPPEVLAKGHTTGISVDAEYDDKGNLTEIGAIAVSLSDWSILGTLQRRAPSMVPISSQGTPAATKKAHARSSDWIESIVQLRRAPRTRKEQAQAEGKALHDRFLEWCREMTTSQPVFLHWGGSEKDLVGEKALTLDVYSSCFVPWLELKGSPRRGDTNLKCALQQLLPQLPFAPHQAFEDALATIAVLLATTDFGGKL